MILQALVPHLLEYRSCRVGSVVLIVPSAKHTILCRALRGAVAEPGSDACCQDALHRISVKV